jgi:hypothetical protein
MNYRKRGIWLAFWIAPMLSLCIAAAMPMEGRAQVTDFDRVSSSDVALSDRSYHRIERFLSHVFPMRQMRRFARVPGNARPTQLRRVTYELVSQAGINFVLAAYSAQWNEPINELAIYRMEDGAPNQVWRSRPWEGCSGDLHFQSAPTRDRNIVLFQEGGDDGTFGIASVFTFKNAPVGLFLHDLTPELPWLRARARFPFRTLYGEHISMRVADEGSASLKNSENDEVVLSASDQEYNLGMARLIRPGQSWRYNFMHNRFDRMKADHAIGEPEATSTR